MDFLYRTSKSWQEGRIMHVLRCYEKDLGLHPKSNVMLFWRCSTPFCFDHKKEPKKEQNPCRFQVGSQVFTEELLWDYLPCLQTWCLKVLNRESLDTIMKDQMLHAISSRNTVTILLQITAGCAFLRTVFEITERRRTGRKLILTAGRREVMEGGKRHTDEILWLLQGLPSPHRICSTCVCRKRKRGRKDRKKVVIP